MAAEIGGPRCAKYILYFTNIIILVLACVTLGVGIWMSSDISDFITTINADMDPSGVGSTAVRHSVETGVGRIQTIANILITSGVFALLVGFLGIWAAYKESKTLLITYGVIMVIIVLLEIGAGIAWSVDKGKIAAGLQAQMDRALPLYDFVQTAIDEKNRIVVTPRQRVNNVTAGPTLLINVVQTWVGCCGASSSGYRDFSASPYWSKAGGVPPVFCCKLANKYSLTLADPACETVRTADNSYMNVGCLNKITSWIYHNASSIVGVAVGIGMVNLLGIAAAFYQYNRLTHKEYKEF